MSARVKPPVMHKPLICPLTVEDHLIMRRRRGGYWSAARNWLDGERDAEVMRRLSGDAYQHERAYAGLTFEEQRAVVLARWRKEP
jgi:hypothetical protein